MLVSCRISSESDVDVCALDDSSDGSPKRQAKKSSTPQKNHTPQKGDPHHKWFVNFFNNLKFDLKGFIFFTHSKTVLRFDGVVNALMF